MKQIKLLIIILTIILIGLAIVTISINFQSQQTNSAQDELDINSILGNNSLGSSDANEMPEFSYIKSITEVTSEEILYNINNKINQYFKYIKEGNNTAVDEICENNIYYIQNDVKYLIDSAFFTENEYQIKYYTKGTLTIADGNFTSSEQSITMIMYVDCENETYKLQNISIEEFDNKLELNEDERANIIQNNYNEYEYEYINNMKRAELYIEDYKFNIRNYIEKAYDLLDEEYRNKRFGSIEEFVYYVSEKYSKLTEIKVLTCERQEDEDENVFYVVTDQFGNTFNIIINKFNDYKIRLDEYTLAVHYKNIDFSSKVENYTREFILMINTADYTNAYNLLEPNFKNKNFPTKQEFIDYLKENFFERNIISELEVEGNNCLVKLKGSISTYANKIDKTFTIQLNGERSFLIKFNIE